MKSRKYFNALSLLFVITFGGLRTLYAQDLKSSNATVARMTVTLRVQGNNKRTPEVTGNDVIVKQGKVALPVTGWTAAREDRAGLELFILLDDASDLRVLSQFDDIRAFINSQPASTLVGVGYIHNGTVDIVQNFTPDHSLAAMSLRPPFAYGGGFQSPFLSVTDLINRWPVSRNRREIVMISDGIDWLHSWPNTRGLGNISPDVDSASNAAQRTGTVIDTIYTPGVGRRSRNYWEITNGQNNIARLSDATGGESYFLGPHSPVSFRPYLDDINMALTNQFILEFQPIPGKRAGMRYVSLSTPIPGVELDAADGVWIAMK